MTQSPRDALAALFPHLDETELAAVHERLERYVRLVVDVVRYECLLTKPSSSGSVEAGQVDPNTFTNTE